MRFHLQFGAAAACWLFDIRSSLLETSGLDLGSRHGGGLSKRFPEGGVGVSEEPREGSTHGEEAGAEEAYAQHDG